MPKSSTRYYSEASSKNLLREALRVAISTPRRNSSSSSMPKTRYWEPAVNRQPVYRRDLVELFSHTALLRTQG
eukprot:9484334-Pyramimonas_sp.AAC.1